MPLPVGTGDMAFMDALKTVTTSIRNFAPDALVISLGLDAHKDDPQGLFALSTNAFEVIGAKIAELGLPTLMVQEGGYAVGDVGSSLIAFLRGYGVAR